MNCSFPKVVKGPIAIPLESALGSKKPRVETLVEISCSSYCLVVNVVVMFMYFA